MRAVVIRSNDEVGLKDKASLMDEGSLMDEASFSSSLLLLFFKDEGNFSTHQSPLVFL